MERFLEKGALISLFDRLAGESLPSELAKDLFRTVIAGKVSVKFYRPKTLIPSSTGAHYGQMVLEFESEEGTGTCEIVKKHWSAGTVISIVISCDNVLSTATVKRISDDDVEKMWDAVMACGFDVLS